MNTGFHIHNEDLYTWGGGGGDIHIIIIPIEYI